MNTPDSVNYEVMSQLPFSNVLYGSGSIYHDKQLQLKNKYPRNGWDVLWPVSRYPDQVSVYDTGLAISPSVQRIVLDM